VYIIQEDDFANQDTYTIYDEQGRIIAYSILSKQAAEVLVEYLNKLQNKS
jgi:hypothetical protein